MKLMKASVQVQYRKSEIYREAVHGRLRWVHNEVAQGEAKTLGGSTQKHSFRSRP